MQKPKIGVYYDLPYGGAMRFLDEVLPRLSADFELVFLPSLKPNSNRLLRDKQNFIDTYLHAKAQNKLIDKQGIRALFVSHDAYFAAPAILAEAKVPTLLYCQEPTRALFEKELKLASSYPIINQLYESCYRSIKRKLEIKNAQKATKVLCNSKYSQQVIANSYHIDSTVVYPGIDTAKFKFTQGMKKNQILIIGNDEPQKRLSLAIEAVSLLDQSTRPVLRIISPTKMVSQAIMNLASSLDVCLDLSVGISDKQLVKEYHASKLTLVTALKEPFGFSAAESLSCGTPVVATKEGGIVEIVQDGKNGLISDSLPQSIKTNLQQILVKDSLGSQLGKNGRLYVETHFNWIKTKDQIKDCLLKLI